MLFGFLDPLYAMILLTCIILLGMLGVVLFMRSMTNYLRGIHEETVRINSRPLPVIFTDTTGPNTDAVPISVKERTS